MFSTYILNFLNICIIHIFLKNSDLFIILCVSKFNKPSHILKNTLMCFRSCSIVQLIYYFLGGCYTILFDFSYTISHCNSFFWGKRLMSFIVFNLYLQNIVKFFSLFEIFLTSVAFWQNNLSKKNCIFQKSKTRVYWRISLSNY